ncbi:hypothetical protein Q2T40_06935 [Winogradskyella maritima]|uniref:Uncharacterized protein n=1 Tax=Winogradskyella maritima TaxID=1517766 RepID=A0ABV8ANJ7_9FLAO|nr:hypothetical protein [Winogradskyella maritima]
MKKTLFSVIAVLCLIISCSSEPKVDPFNIGKTNIGYLNDSTQVKDLNTIFKNDSLFNFKEDDGFTGNINNIEVFEKNGNPLLIITPSEALDSTAVLSSIRIMDSRYATDKGISTMSTFKDIKDAYKINSISNLISTIVVNVNEINASFTIDKNELPANMRFDMDMTIDPIQIPDNAKIKYFIVHW